FRPLFSGRSFKGVTQLESRFRNSSQHQSGQTNDVSERVEFDPEDALGTYDVPVLKRLQLRAFPQTASAADKQPGGTEAGVIDALATLRICQLDHQIDDRLWSNVSSEGPAALGSPINQLFEDLIRFFPVFGLTKIEDPDPLNDQIEHRGRLSELH